MMHLSLQPIVDTRFLHCPSTGPSDKEGHRFTYGRTGRGSKDDAPYVENLSEARNDGIIRNWNEDGSVGYRGNYEGSQVAKPP